MVMRMIFFYAIFIFLILQRLIELVIARRNREWMMRRGGQEVGAEHYPFMVTMHVVFFASLWLETAWRGYPLSPAWIALLVLLAFVQLLRYWALISLGPYWNTRIIFVPGDKVVKKGPYRFLRHPNYMAVIIEIAIIPLLFHAYFTSFIFSLLNAWMLHHRIRIEEEALCMNTTYSQDIGNLNRFIPKRSID